MPRSLQMKCNVFMWKHVIWHFSLSPLGNKFLESHVTSRHQGLSRSPRRYKDPGLRGCNVARRQMHSSVTYYAFHCYLHSVFI